ncbi:MAG: glycogen/starch synthase, partial [Candidatus Limivicinus sp.]
MSEDSKVKTETAADGTDVVLNAAETPAAPEAKEAAAEKKPAAKKTAAKKPAAKKPAAKKPAAKKTAEPKAEEAAPADPAEEKSIVEEAAPVTEETVPAPETEEAQPDLSPRRSVAFIGSECYPFVKTGGLGDVMYALPRALVKQNCDVKVILPRYRCIPQEYQDKMIYRGEFYMDLCSDGRRFYVGIMEYVWDGVVYDFIDNEDFFSYGNPYTNLVDDIPRYCFFSKAALAVLNYLNWIPDIVHCHDWQAALVPVYLKTQFAGTPVASAKSILTIHNLRFQGAYGVNTLHYWTGLPDYLLTSMDVFKEGWDGANSLKAGTAYADRITTVSPTYASEIQTQFYGDGLDAHLRH